MNDQAEEAHYRHTKLRVAVVAMRDAQKSYFRTRDNSALRRAKELEAQVDKILSEP
jgi:hypothetical protein